MKEVIRVSRSEFENLRLLVEEVQFFLEKLEYRFVYEWSDDDFKDSPILEEESKLPY